MSWAEWKAQMLNRLSQRQGVLKQRARITPETVRHGEKRGHQGADTSYRLRRTDLYSGAATTVVGDMELAPAPLAGSTQIWAPSNDDAPTIEIVKLEATLAGSPMSGSGAALQAGIPVGGRGTVKFS
jgi:hypothetical protein